MMAEVHYHRCDWCGVLMECHDVCGQGGPYDPYEPSEMDENRVFPGNACSQDCYNHKRPRGCQRGRTEDGRILGFE
jgi:hypothetical protein